MPAPVVPPNNPRFAYGGVLALTVVVFAVAVGVVTLQLRRDIRAQLLRGEADKLAALVSMQLNNRAEELDSGVPLGQVPALLLNAVLRTSKYPGIAGVAVFDSERRYDAAWPFPTSEEPPSPHEWAELKGGRSVARMHDGTLRDEVMALLPTGIAEPLIEAWVPLRQTASSTWLGAAQFWVRAGGLNADLATHDQRLWMQAAIAWLVGSAVIVAGLSWAFRGLAAANRKLHARGEDLQRANRELVLAAKTSALGAVTAHLMHELKNPLAGLELIMAGQSEGLAGDRPEPGSELVAASELTRRLRTMVNDVVGVLRDEQSGAKFELTAADVVEIVVGKVKREADERGVKIESQAEEGISLSGRRANLATLVLRNLVQNALEATPAGGSVKLRARPTPQGEAEFIVEDGGAGLPTAVRGRLFQPCASTKVGGSGLGLALSYQIAQQARGRLELLRSDEHGTSFRLVLSAEA